MTDAQGAEGAALPHPDDDELAAARAEPATPPEGEQAPPAEEPKTDPAAAPAAEPDPVMIPKARFDEAVLKARAEAAYYKGQADALARVAATGGKAAAPEVTPEQEAEQIEEAIVQKAQDLDEGKIGNAEFKRFEIQASRRLAELRQPVPARETDPSSDTYLDQLTAELPKRFPVLDKLQDRHVMGLKDAAIASLQDQGVTLGPDGRSAYLIRERIAAMAQRLYGDATTQPKPTGQPDPQKAARDKVALAAKMAPNLTTLAAGNRPVEPMSDEALEQMDADDWAAMPDSVRLKKLGVTT